MIRRQNKKNQTFGFKGPPPPCRHERQTPSPREPRSKGRDGRLHRQPRQAVVHRVREHREQRHVERGGGVQVHRVVEPLGHGLALLVQGTGHERRIEWDDGIVLVVATHPELTAPPTSSPLALSVGALFATSAPLLSVRGGGGHLRWGAPCVATGKRRSKESFLKICKDTERGK